MTRQITVRIWWDLAIGAYRCSFPYNKELVEILSSKIPVSDRSFDESSRTWTFVERQLPLVQGLLKFVNAQVKITERSAAEANAAASQHRNTNSSSRNPIDTAIVEFVRLAPYDAMLKAYRQAQLTLHPDRGGDADASARLNVAWDRIRKEVFKQQ